MLLIPACMGVQCVPNMALPLLNGLCCVFLNSGPTFKPLLAYKSHAFYNVPSAFILRTGNEQGHPKVPL